MATHKQQPEKGLADLPVDELRSYAAELGIATPHRYTHADLLRRVRQQREVLLDLDREALLDVMVWARKPVRRSASKEQLAKMIAGIEAMRFDGLSHRGLLALARLRSVDVSEGDSDRTIAAKIRGQGGVWQRLARRRRSVIGWALERIVEGKKQDRAAYQFLPEEPGSREPGLRQEVENQGVVAGLAGRLRHVADDYIAAKLDEIESRIDQKLDEIDARLAEWRDREVANRLRIIKITLVASLVVALISLGYKYGSSRVAPEGTTRPAQGRVSGSAPDSVPSKGMILPHRLGF